MTHFSLAVFTDSRPSNQILDQILAPYEESPDNSQSKLDWWMIGGRWLGQLLVKAGVTDFILAETRVFDRDTPPGGVDGARIGDLDLAAMLKHSRGRHAGHWDYAFQDQLTRSYPHPLQVDTTLVSRDQYIALATVFSPFAYVLDGQWHEKGEIGFGVIVQSEDSQVKWNSEFAAVLARQPADHWITIIDCHI